MQRYFRIAFACWIASLLVGFIVVGLLPDNLLGAMPLFRLSDNHGPTPLDIIGIVPVATATAFYVGHIWRSRKKMRLHGYILVGSWAAASVTAVVAASFNLDQLLVISIALGIGSLLVLGMSMTMNP